MVTRSKQNLAARRWQGCLQGMYGQYAYGWAIDTLHSDARVVLEACIDDEAIGLVFADVARPDVEAIASACGDVCHGFMLDLGRITSKGTLSVRIANAGQELPGKWHLDAAPAAPRSALSHVFSDGGLRIQGWLIDPARPDSALEVRAFSGAQQVGQALANLEHPGLRSQQVGAHGFKLDLPLDLADGQIHEIRFVDESGMALNGSPLKVCCHTNPLAILPEDASGLLGQVLQNYLHTIPRSVGWHDYPAWTEQFAPSGASVQKKRSSKQTKPMFAIVVYASGPVNECVLELPPDAGCQVFYAGTETQAFSAGLQQALASGAQWLACVRAGDSLPGYALASLRAACQIDSACIIYADSEHALGKGLRPWLKPAWNWEYALACDYVLELMLLKTTAIKAQFQESLPTGPAQLAWGMIARYAGEQGAIVHVPHVLYRFNSPLSESQRQQRLEAAQAALTQCEPGARLLPMSNPDPDACARRLQRPASWQPAVSLIIPTRDQLGLLQACIDSILQFNDYPRLELIVVDNGSSERNTLSYLRKLQKQGVTVIDAPGQFNFARLNNLAVAQASGEVIGMINNDIQVLHTGWLQEMLSHLQQPTVGAVGAKLLWPNRMVQHGGIVLGPGHVAGHYGNLLADDDWGDHGRNQLTHQVSGVTAACLLMRKQDYLALGGMDEVAFPVAFNDVDLCLRLRQQGKAIVWTPFAKLLHAESASRGQEDTPQKRARAQREIEQLRQRWGETLLHDPAYHPSLNLDAHSHAFSGLALPPRNRQPRLANLVCKDK